MLSISAPNSLLWACEVTPNPPIPPSSLSNYTDDLICQSVARLCQPVEVEEEGVITLSLTNNHTEHQVMEIILQHAITTHEAEGGS